jgi:hypothetical protein
VSIFKSVAAKITGVVRPSSSSSTSTQSTSNFNAKEFIQSGGTKTDAATAKETFKKEAIARGVSPSAFTKGGSGTSTPTPTTPQVYQGAVPQGVSEEVFRQTGTTVKVAPTVSPDVQATRDRAIAARELREEARQRKIDISTPAKERKFLDLKYRETKFNNQSKKITEPTVKKSKPLSPSLQEQIKQQSIPIEKRNLNFNYVLEQASGEVSSESDRQRMFINEPEKRSPIKEAVFDIIRPKILPSTKGSKTILKATELPIINQKILPFTQPRTVSISQIGYEQSVARDYLSEQAVKGVSKVPDKYLESFGLRVPFTDLKVSGKQVVTFGAKVAPDVAAYSTPTGAIAFGSADILAAKYKMDTGKYESNAEKFFKESYKTQTATPAGEGFEYIPESQYVQSAMTSPEVQKSLKYQKIIDVGVPALFVTGSLGAKAVRTVREYNALTPSDLKIVGVQQVAKGKKVDTKVIFSVEKGSKEKLGIAKVKTIFGGKVVEKGKTFQSYMSEGNAAYLEKQSLYTGSIEFPTGKILMKQSPIDTKTISKIAEGGKARAINPKTVISSGTGFSSTSRYTLPKGETKYVSTFKGFSIGRKISKDQTLIYGKSVSGIGEKSTQNALIYSIPKKVSSKAVKSSVSYKGKGLLDLPEGTLKSAVPKPARIIPRADYFTPQENVLMETQMKKMIIDSQKSAAKQSAIRSVQGFASAKPIVKETSVISPYSVSGKVLIKPQQKISTTKVSTSQVITPTVKQTPAITQSSSSLGGLLYKQKGKQVAVQSQSPIQTPILRQTPSQTVGLKQKLKQKLVQVQVTKQKQVPIVPIRTNIGRPVGRIPKLFFGFKKSSQSGINVQRYNVYMRRRSKFGLIGSNLNWQNAFRIGKLKTKTTLGATFKIEKLGGDAMDFGTPFGYYKKPSKQGILFIQKSSTRLSNPLERQEIQFWKRNKNKGVYNY